ncbi:MAG: amidohydrolase family protein [Armatimonadota bacterium]|nr:amidohydrolase [Armatimonadota bacterium]MDW8156488.1 amidohydrolase family protein [Armatimonadota bacterium]
MIVDVHTHFYPQAYLALLDQHGQGVRLRTDSQGRRYLEQHGTRLATLTPPMVDLDERLRVMDRLGVAVQVLSLTSPNVYVFPEAVAVQVARQVNQAYAEIKDRYPRRFRCLASVPLGTGAEVDELDHAVQVLGLDGVVVGTTVGSRPVDDPRFEPFWRRADELGLVVFLHPMGGLASPHLREFSLLPLVGFPTETTVGLARLVYSGFFDRYPRVRLIAPHAGGAVPYLMGRLDTGYRAYAECATTPRPPGEALRTVYYDTVNRHPPALRCLLDTVGPGRVVFGSDFPHVIGHLEDGVRGLREAGLAAEAMEAVLHGNARRLFGIP